MYESISVLHVEDDRDFADLASTFLRREDQRISIRHAPTPDDGISIVSEKDIDCVVSDYDMPGHNGIEFLKQVRSKDPELPFILFTGKGSEEIAGQAISAGVTDYLQKESGTEQYRILTNRIINVVEQTRAQQEREQIRERMQLALEHTDSIIFEIDLQTGEVIRHGAFEQYFDLRPREVPTWEDHLKQAVHPDDQERFRESYGALINGDHKQGVIEYRTNPNQGRVRWIEDTISIEPESIDDRPLAVGIARDITAYKDHELELRRRDRRYQAVFNDPNILVGLIDMDGTVLDINEKAMTYIDDSKEYVIGEPFWETAWFNHSEAVQHEVKEWIDSAASGEYVEFEADLVDPEDGEYTIQGVFRPVLDEDDEVVSLLISDRDITEQKRHERNQAETVDALENLYEITTETGLSFETKITRILELGCEKLNLPYGFLTEINVEDLATGRGSQRIVNAVGEHDLLLQGESCPLSEAYCRKTIHSDSLLAVQNALAAGWEDDPAYETFNLGCYIGAKVNVNDELFGTLCFASTTPREEPFQASHRSFVRLIAKWASYERERDQAQTQLQRQNEQLAEFANVVSHDLRNPLSVAEGRLALAREDDDNEDLVAVSQAHDRMEALIDDLLTLSQQEDEVTELTSVELDSVVHSCWSNVETLDVTLAPHLDRWIRADENRLKQLFENLMRNAAEHGGKTVTVSIGELADGFYVQDDGPGIPEEMRHEIFEAGFSSSDQGTGFGLSIVKQVVESHGWDIRVTTNERGGARFEITGVTVVD